MQKPGSHTFEDAQVPEWQEDLSNLAYYRYLIQLYLSYTDLGWFSKKIFLNGSSNDPRAFLAGSWLTKNP